jgi:transposase, IS5 family
MRQVINPQLQFGEQAISAIELDSRSRDDIPRILAGLQHIYQTRRASGRGRACLS